MRITASVQAQPYRKVLSVPFFLVLHHESLRIEILGLLIPAVVDALKPCKEHCLSLSPELASKYLRIAFLGFVRITASVQAQPYRKVLSVPFFLVLHHESRRGLSLALRGLCFA